MEDDTPLTALTAVTAFPEHIINETVYGQESFRTQCVYGQESGWPYTLCTGKHFLFFMQGPADIQEEQEDGRQSDWAALEQSGSDFFPLILRLKIWNASWSQITQQASPFSLLLARAILSGTKLSLTLSGKLASK